jgi:hypothetical protein
VALGVFYLFKKFKIACDTIGNKFEKSGCQVYFFFFFLLENQDRVRYHWQQIREEWPSGLPPPFFSVFFLDAPFSTIHCSATLGK